MSGISLDEINRMEREFLLGVDFNLYVDKMTYASWLNLLKGLVLAKERDARRLLRGGAGNGGGRMARRGVREREGRFWHPHQHQHPQHQQHHQQYQQQNYAHPRAQKAYAVQTPVETTTRRQDEAEKHRYRYRARSTSPRSFAFSTAAASSRPPVPVPVAVPVQEQRYVDEAPYYQPGVPAMEMEIDVAYQLSPTPVPVSVSGESTVVSEMGTGMGMGVKRSADDAFSSPPPTTMMAGFMRPQEGRTVSRLRRPASMYGRLHTLQIPEYSTNNDQGMSSSSNSVGNGSVVGDPSPLEGLGGFERMSLDEEERERERREREQRREGGGRQVKRPRAGTTTTTTGVIPRTLMAAYEVDESRRDVLPKVCSFSFFFFVL